MLINKIPTINFTSLIVTKEASFVPENIQGVSEKGKNQVVITLKEPLYTENPDLASLNLSKIARSDSSYTIEIDKSEKSATTLKPSIWVKEESRNKAQNIIKAEIDEYLSRISIKAIKVTGSLESVNNIILEALKPENISKIFKL